MRSLGFSYWYRVPSHQLRWQQPFIKESMMNKNQIAQLAALEVRIADCEVQQGNQQYAVRAPSGNAAAGSP
jgi:hypothetical protein